MSFLVNVYAKCGVMVNARKVFDNLPRSNVVVWITLITGYVQNSQPKVAVAVLGDVLFLQISLYQLLLMPVLL
jgi:hypothetical protein